MLILKRFAPKTRQPARSPAGICPFRCHTTTGDGDRVGHRREPHQPIDAQMIRRDLRRPARRIARAFLLKEIPSHGLPRDDGFAVPSITIHTLAGNFQSAIRSRQMKWL